MSGRRWEQDNPNYVEDRKKALNFLKGFTEDGKKKYLEIAQSVADRNLFRFTVELDDVFAFEADMTFVQCIESNTKRYEQIFADAIDDKSMPQADISLYDDVFDVMLNSRMLQHNERMDPEAMANPMEDIPPELRRRYEVVFVPRSTQKPTPIRHIASANIGGLVKTTGIVVRVSDVKPLLKVGTYTCDKCGIEVYHRVPGRSFTPLEKCPHPDCIQQGYKEPLHMMTRGSKFIKFQEIKLQELPENVPEGNVPRSVTVYAFGLSTRKCTAGDKIDVSGIWLPAPFTGFKAMKAGLTANTYLQAMSIHKKKKSYAVKTQDEALRRQVREAQKDPQIYHKLAKSIAPEIFGHEDVKKAMLLLLIAGVTKTQSDGMRIRGDINVLLMGDPGVAKSQLLKHLVQVAPRCIYTTGKGSSGVGLTAAVMKDQITGDMTLEGGALVLADMGICCIDEFDKMEEADRTAIHEVMEQQTVSIAKAGITTTLNARTAIIAAANPAFGRYDKNRSPEANINIPAALLSRFDMVFVLVDRPNIDNDMALAKHITYVHQHERHPELDFEPFTSEFMRAYVTEARQYEPTIPRKLAEYMTAAYVQERQQCQKEDGTYDSTKIVATPRALLSILRVSQALARLNFRNEVIQGDIEEAMRLIRESRRSTLKDDDKKQDQADDISAIYTHINNHLKSRGADQCKISDFMNALITKGFSKEDIAECLDVYQNNDVWHINDDRDTLQLCL